MKSWPVGGEAADLGRDAIDRSTARTTGTTAVPAGLSGASGLIASRRTVESRR